MQREALVLGGYMKIIHCADLHLDSNMTANLTGEKAKERKNELLMTFRNMIQFAEEQGVEAVMIAGDLFDKKKVTKTAMNAVQQAIEGHPEMDFYYLQGNHDADSFLSSLENIPDNLKLFGDTWTSYKADKEGSITITGVEFNGENQGQIYDTLVLNTDCYNIVLLHGQEAEYAGKDKGETIHIRQLKNKGIDYLALGHIHSYREEALDGRGVYCYPGCLEGRGFDECGEHGFVLLEIDGQTRQCRRRFVPIARRQIYAVDIDVTGCNSTMDMAERIEAKLQAHAYPQTSLMKFVLVGELDVECEKNIDYLVKQFEPCFYFLKIYDETGFHVDYKAFARDVSLKGEFVRTVMKEETLSEEEKAEIIRYGIQILAGEEV